MAENERDTGKTGRQAAGGGQAGGQTGPGNRPGPETGPETGGRKTEEEKHTRPALVDITVPAPEKKKRGRPPKASKETEDSGIGTAEIGMLVAGIFGLLSIPLGQHWQITPQEAQQVADPASRIIARMNMSEQVSKYSDPILLIMALATISVPRMMITLASKGKGNRREAQERGGTGVPGEKGQAMPGNAGDTRQNARPVGGNVADILPALA